MLDVYKKESGAQGWGQRGQLTPPRPSEKVGTAGLCSIRLLPRAVAVFFAKLQRPALLILRFVAGFKNWALSILCY